MKMNMKETLAKLKTLSLVQANQALGQSLKEARDICDLVDSEKRDFTAEERTDVAELLEGAKQIKAQVKQLKGDAQMREMIDSLGDGITMQDGADQRTGRKFSVGELFTNSAEWLAWLKQVSPSGHIPDSKKGISSPPISFKNFGLFKKDLIIGGGDTSAGAFVNTDITGIYEPLGRYTLNMRDIISVRTTTSDTVEFVRQTLQASQATPVPESNVTDYSGYPGQVSGLKPEASVAYERVTETVKTIAVWIPATKRALSDAAQIRGMIDQELRDDVNEELENQILNGDGSGENFTGLSSTANVLIQPFVTDILVTTRKAITNLLVNGKQVPTAWVFNPVDWEAFELSTDQDGSFRWGGPVNTPGPKTLWGVPVSQSFFQTQGTAWLGNFRKAVLWDREQATITASDSHADFFIRNMVAILAEMRAAFGVIRPTAFVETSLSSS